MSWNTSLISGPLQIPILSVDGITITGYSPGIVFVLPADQVTNTLQAYASAVPVGIPVLGGVTCLALTFSDELTAQSILSDYWSNDS